MYRSIQKNLPISNIVKLIHEPPPLDIFSILWSSLGWTNWEPLPHQSRWRQYFRVANKHQRAAPTIATSSLWEMDQDAGFIMLSTWPPWTWNTQVLWLLQPPQHELSIRPFESNSPAWLCHLYFHNCFGVLILSSTQGTIGFTSSELLSCLQKWRNPVAVKYDMQT